MDKLAAMKIKMEGKEHLSLEKEMNSRVGKTLDFSFLTFMKAYMDDD